MQWALNVDDVALVVRLASLTEDRSTEEQVALLRLARAVDRRRAGSNVLEGEVLATWWPEESGDSQGAVWRAVRKHWADVPLEDIPDWAGRGHP